jgi:hypothetical protein
LELKLFVGLRKKIEGRGTKRGVNMFVMLRRTLSAN